MAKVLKCGDVVPGCDFEMRGNSEEEVLQKAAEHAKTDLAWPASRPRSSTKSAGRSMTRARRDRRVRGRIEASISTDATEGCLAVGPLFSASADRTRASRHRPMSACRVPLPKATFATPSGLPG
jgi:hypothetical protein